MNYLFNLQNYKYNIWIKFADSIEQNVETAYHHVESGKDELSKASTYQVSVYNSKSIKPFIIIGFI